MTAGHRSALLHGAALIGTALIALAEDDTETREAFKAEIDLINEVVDKDLARHAASKAEKLARRHAERDAKAAEAKANGTDTVAEEAKAVKAKAAAKGKGKAVANKAATDAEKDAETDESASAESASDEYMSDETEDAINSVGVDIYATNDDLVGV